jgi:hypothetical protein
MPAVTERRRRYRLPDSNVPSKVLRWSVERASREFKLAPNTLRKILNQSGAEPDQTGCYSTSQITTCIFGDLRAEKLRKERELTKKYALENAIVEAEVLNRAALTKGLEMVADAITSRVMAVPELSRIAKEDLLTELSSIPLVLDEVAHRQTRLPARANGKRPNGADDD